MSTNELSNLHPHEVRIHIDQQPHKSPNPTTGEALYRLGHVKAGLKLYREVKGDEEDRAIENGLEVVHLSTPIGPTDWAMEETPAGPTLEPSVGNWQLPCKSHYFIREGRIVWASAWTPEQITAGRQAEKQRHRAYFEDRARQRGNVLQRAWRWIKNFFDMDR